MKRNTLRTAALQLALSITMIGNAGLLDDFNTPNPGISFTTSSAGPGGTSDALGDRALNFNLLGSGGFAVNVPPSDLFLQAEANTFALADVVYDTAPPFDLSYGDTFRSDVRSFASSHDVVTSLTLEIGGVPIVVKPLPIDGSSSTLDFPKSNWPSVDWSNVDKVKLTLIVNSGGSHHTGTFHVENLRLVPEPHEYALIAGIGLAGLVGYRRFRKG